MPSFRHQSLDAKGAVVSGVIAATDRAAAIRQLSSRGQRPVSIVVVDEDSTPSKATAAPRADGSKTKASLFSMLTAKSTLSRSELANFIRELATALEAGLPLMQALRTVRQQASGHAQAVILDRLIEKVEAGQPLQQAMADYGPPFDEMVVGMVRAADASGRMPEVLHQLADLLERGIELRRELVGATIYPLIVAVMILVSVVILVTVILPRLMEPLLASGTPLSLPWPTRVLMGFADFMQAWWWAVILGIGGALIGWRLWISNPENRLMVHRALLRLPIVGVLLRDVAVARFTRTLGTLVSAGLQIIPALRIVRDTLGNLVLMQAIDEVTERVSTGQSLAEPLERCGHFPPILIQIVNIGERSGRLESMLLHAAGAFDRQVNASIKVLTKALPPVLLVIMACLAGFVLLGILLPLMNLQSAFMTG
ncbi:MAG: type II secretion system F family protein [Phycisphaeraceae bacterium]|nr:type II secretion system F family protein [Phycisphaeraceae bacterium]